MKKLYLTLLLLTLISIMLFPSPIFAQNIDPQYIFVRKSAMHCIPDCSYLWNFDVPGNINTTTMLDIPTLVGSYGNDQRKLGIGVEINYNHVYDFNRIKQSLSNLLYESEKNTVPVFINLNGVQWWGDVNLGWNGRPDLWNWWDPTKSGYNPDNVNNVEWTCWNSSCAIKKAWRDWGGGEFEVRPHPNLASRVFIDSSKGRLAELIPIIVNWYTALPFDKKWLLGGVANGTEIDIGNNYRAYNNDIPRGDLAQTLQLGYAAVKTTGIRSSGGSPTSEELNEVIRRYLNELDKFVYDKGIPRSKIYNHTGGFDIFANPLPSRPVFPTTAGALTQYGTPGWSFYGAVNTNPQNYTGLSATLNQINNSEWASPEWNPMILPSDINQFPKWVDALRNTLTYRNNRFINISNWEDTVRPSGDVIRAIRTVLNESPTCWVTAPRMVSITNNGNAVTLTWEKGTYDHVYLYVSNTAQFGNDGILTDKNIAWENITNSTGWSKNLAPGKYYWEFAADGCVDSQFRWQERTSDGSFVVAVSTPTRTPTPSITKPPTPTPRPPTPTPIPGDITGKDGVPDGKVDIYDYNLLIGDFGKTNSPADIDGNGMIDIYDYNILITNFDKHN